MLNLEASPTSPSPVVETTSTLPPPPRTLEIATAPVPDLPAEEQINSGARLTAEENQAGEDLFARSFSETVPEPPKAVEPPPVQGAVEPPPVLGAVEPPPVQGAVEPPPVITAVEPPPVLPKAEVVPPTPPAPESDPAVAERLANLEAQFAKIADRINASPIAEAAPLAPPTEARVGKLKEFWTNFTDYRRSQILNATKFGLTTLNGGLERIVQSIDQMQSARTAAAEVKSKIRVENGRVRFDADVVTETEPATPEKDASLSSIFTDELTIQKLDAFEGLALELDLTPDERIAMIAEEFGPEVAGFHELIQQVPDGLEQLRKMKESGVSDNVIQMVIARKASEANPNLFKTDAEVKQVEAAAAEAAATEDTAEQEDQAAEKPEAAFERIPKVEASFQTTFTPDLAYSAAAREYMRLSTLSDESEFSSRHEDLIYGPYGTEPVQANSEYQVEGATTKASLEAAKSVVQMQAMFFARLGQHIVENRSSALSLVKQDFITRYGGDNVDVLRVTENGNPNPDAYIDGMSIKCEIQDGRVKLTFEDPNVATLAMKPRSDLHAKVISPEGE